ncbi:DUF6894 family protein [Methylobrevis pamukkalensis]|uniref:DUF6894 domain-containing protein n=1 Tax=Methylobrevis pamukkalensis TaxID=1439726 RepID=A0A1E3H6P9_9HYPH|nr:hypothetical protein [Methylobrevis pamukkalensis]ODN71825.1 hypothetical protein A6302_00864 [Methylobrevis pamukkalensis]
MARFYFDIDDGLRLIRDQEGVEFASLGDVSTAAIGVLSPIASDHLPDGRQRVYVVKVRDDTDRYIFVATLSLVSERLD